MELRGPSRPARLVGCGPAVEVHGETLRAFPGPARLRKLDDFPGLFGRKAEWLRAIATATLESRLDAARAGAPAEEALAELRALPGIGPFGSEHILLRGGRRPRLIIAGRARTGEQRATTVKAKRGGPSS